jgi:hypothetical protein
MSNLSDLLPAGAGGKQVDFVATGTLPSGQAVALKTDGTVEAVVDVPASLGTPVTTTFAGSEGLYVSMLTSTTFVGSGRDDAAVAVGAGTCVIGTVSGGAITFGTKVLAGTLGYPSYPQVVALSATQFVFLYTGSGPPYIVSGTAVGATVSGTSITFGALTTFEAGSTSINTVSACTRLSDTTFVIVLTDASDSANAKAIIGTIDASNVVSFGSPYTFATANSSLYAVVTALSSTKLAIAWSDTPSPGPEEGMVVIGTVSAGTISFGTAVVFTAQYMVRQSIVALSETKFVIAYQEDRTASPLIQRAIVGSVSGTTITLGSPATYVDPVYANRWPFVLKLSESTFCVLFMASTTHYGALRIGTVSGTSITYDTVVIYNSATTFGAYGGYSAASGIVIGYDVTNFTGVTYSLSSTNNTDFVGITDEAISSAATGSVTIKGGISSTVTGLTPNLSYYVQDDGTLSTVTSTVLAGKALSPTSINLDYTT